MGKIKLLIGKRRLSVPRRIISRAWDEVLSMPDSEFDFENPQIAIITKREPTKKKPIKKAKSKTTAAKNQDQKKQPGGRSL